MIALTQAVTILMIEDDEGHARLLEKNIRRAGVTNTIVHLKTGTSTIDYLFGDGPGGCGGEDHPLLILLDLNLPDMTGIDILKQLKESDHLKRAPVIVLTTTDDRTEIQRCYDLGCNVYITKPLIYQNFTNAIRQLGLFLSVIQFSEPVKA